MKAQTAIKGQLQARDPSERWLYPLLIILCLFSSGCVSLTDLETSQVQDQDPVAVLDAEGRDTAGQTFVPRRSGLDSIIITLSAQPSESDVQATLSFSLYLSPEDQWPIYQADISTQPISAKTSFKIPIKDLSVSPLQSLYLNLRAYGKSLVLYGRSEDLYPQGEAYVNDEPLLADLAFQTTYRYNWFEFRQDISTFIRSSWLFLPLFLICFLPGWFLLTSSGLHRWFEPAERVGLAVGISLALIPLALMWSSLAGFFWSTRIVLIGAGFLTAIALSMAILRRKIERPRSAFQEATQSSSDIQPKQAHLSLLILFTAGLGIRLIMVRDMATPAWVDSVHHALITRLILDYGSFPFAYTPYFDFQPTDYHAGFHSIVASFIWLSGMPIPGALLILGQVLNALSIFAIYLITYSLTGNRLAGILAALLTGFFTPMPAYYTSWGRYTQLSGLLILPAFHALWGKLFYCKDLRSWKYSWILGLIAAGLFLVHYRVATFLVFLMLAEVVSHIPIKQSELKNWIKKITIILLPASIVGLLAALPWFWPALTRTILPLLNKTVHQPSAWFSGFSWKYLDAGLGEYTLWLAGLGLIAGLVRKQRFSFTLLLWTALLLLLPNLGMLHLPGGSLVNMTAVAITLFVPISILGGYFLSLAYHLTQRLISVNKVKAFSWFSLILSAGLIILGSRSILTILNSQTIQTRQADLQAIEWVDTFIPHDQTIAINSFLWGYGLYAGSDGGAWIMPLTGNATLPPPVLYALSDTEKVRKITQLCESIITHGKDAQRLREILLSEGIRYLYLGARGGAISPHALQNDPDYQLLYAKGGVWIFKIR